MRDGMRPLTHHHSDSSLLPWCSLQARKRKPFVQASALGTAWKQCAGFVFKFECANSAAQDVAKGEAFAALPAIFGNQPGAEDEREHQPEVDENEPVEADGNHGEGWATP